MNPIMEQRRHSKRQGETAVAAAREPVVEFIARTGETADEADPETATVEQIKSLPLFQLAVPNQHPPS